MKTQAVDKFYKIMKKCGKTVPSPKRLQQYRRIYPTENPIRVAYRKDRHLLNLFGFCLLLFLAIGGAGFLFHYNGKALQKLNRPEYGEETAAYKLEVEKEDGERVQIEISLEEMLSQEKANELLLQAQKEVEQVLEKNGKDHVESSIELPETAQQGKVILNWTSLDRNLLDDYGTVLKKNDQIAKEGEKARLLLSLNCGEYSADGEIEITIFPAEVSEEEAFAAKLKDEIEEQDSSQVSLPETFEGRSLIWYEKEENLGGWMLMIPILLAGCFFFREPEERKKELKKREKELLLDYTEVISRFTVLFQAGISIRNIWKQMVMEYQKRVSEGGPRRFVYEEMNITWKQLENGHYESKAYGDFGQRCGIHSYIKFGALLEQNLRLGAGGLAVRLREEAEHAFEERRNVARRLGEEADTKLMLPMFLMLFVVLAVVMTPAMLAF